MSDVEKARTQVVQNYHNEHAVAPAARPIEIGNPSALGLFSFASTSFILSLYNLNARGTHTPNVIAGMAYFSGGLAQFLAGGVFGILTALAAFYCGLSDLLVKEESWFSLPLDKTQ